MTEICPCGGTYIHVDVPSKEALPHCLKHAQASLALSCIFLTECQDFFECQDFHFWSALFFVKLPFINDVADIFAIFWSCSA